MSEAFGVALDRLYAVFAAPRPRIIEGCPCCLDGKGIDVLLGKPLRGLTDRDLAEYAASVFLTVGGPRDFTYLLPRILEVSATTPGWYPTVEIVLGKLSQAGWDGWRQSERDAVLSVLSAWFDQVARGPQQGEGAVVQIEDLVCGLARAGLDLSPYLERLSAPGNLDGLVGLISWAEGEKLDPDRPRSFWKEAPAGWRQVTAFVTQHL